MFLKIEIEPLIDKRLNESLFSRTYARNEDSSENTLNDEREFDSDEDFLVQGFSCPALGHPNILLVGALLPVLIFLDLVDERPRFHQIVNRALHV
jgi:hypothetical protein